MTETCPRCAVEMKPGLAIEQTWTVGTPDFPRDYIVTMLPGGPGRLVACLKCPSCGHSVTAPPSIAHSR